MSAYVASACPVLINSSGIAVGIIGIDGREWLFPATPTSGPDGPSSAAFTEILFDSTNKPVGILSSGVEYVFASAFTVNLTPGLIVARRSSLVSSSGQPLGVSNALASNFPVPPTASGGSAAPTDPDVAIFAAAVTAAGGSLPAPHLAALNANIAALKVSGAWAAIKEMWLPLGAAGDLVTAAVKLKNGATNPSLTFSNLVAGDYTIAKGIDFGVPNTTKVATTDFSPAVNGALAAGEWGISAYVTRYPVNLTGIIMGPTANSTMFLHYQGSGGQNKMGNAGLTLRPTNTGGTEATASKRLITCMATGGSQYAYYGGWPKNSAVLAVPALPAGGMTVGGCAASFFCDVATSGYAIHATLTPAQLRALQTFIDNVCAAIGRTVFGTQLTAMGDSYVQAGTPVGPSIPANDYIDLVAAARGYAPNRVGVGGRGWATTNPSTPTNIFSGSTGQVGRDAIFTGVLNNPSTHVFFPMGINDSYYGTATGLGTGAGTDGLLATEMNVIFDMLLAQGYPTSYLAIGTTYWSSLLPDQTIPAAVRVQQLAIAAARGINVVDFYHGLTADPAVGGQAPSLAIAMGYQDGSVLHKNDSGHVQLANDVLAVIGGWTGW